MNQTPLKLIIKKDLKFFCLLIIAWLITLLLGLTIFISQVEIMLLIWTFMGFLTVSYFLYFISIYVSTYKQLYRLVYLIFSIFLISPFLFFLAVYSAMGGGRILSYTSGFLLFAQYPIFHLINNFIQLSSFEPDKDITVSNSNKHNLKQPLIYFGLFLILALSVFVAFSLIYGY